MKWYEMTDPLGDPGKTQRRFRKEKAAEAWRNKVNAAPFEEHMVGPIVEVNTDNPGFWTLTEEQEDTLGFSK